MKLLIFVTSLSLTLARRLGDDIQVEWCGDGRPGDIEMMDIDPLPIVVHSGATISIGFKVNLKEEIPVGTSIKLSVVKEGLLPLPIPCVDLNGTPVGSCEYTLDGMFSAGENILCGDVMTPGGYFPEGQDCALPLKIGEYGGGNPITITLPDLPDDIIDLVVSGK